MWSLTPHGQATWEHGWESAVVRGRHGGGGMSQKRAGLGTSVAQAEKGLTIGQRHCLFVGEHVWNQDCGGSNTCDEEFSCGLDLLLEQSGRLAIPR